MKDWGAVVLFEHLLDNFSFLVATARSTTTPNVEDTDNVKAAIVGFYQFTEPENWTFQDWQSVTAWLDGVMIFDLLENHPSEQLQLSLFAGLAYGAMLGKNYLGELSEADFVLGEMQLFLFLQTNWQRIAVELPNIA